MKAALALFVLVLVTVVIGVGVIVASSRPHAGGACDVIPAEAGCQ